ncbi:uncharacterized protein [Musca autumnalis]|uniref:uncharacterized protein n=1 Tax=Musca autumnalis TaxID=221902 RepID=UPI003CE6DF37
MSYIRGDIFVELCTMFKETAKLFVVVFAVIAAVAADVSHLPTNEYLPPQQDAVAAPTNEYLPPVQAVEPAHELADDGYRYKTNRRVVYRRNRRDVSHLPSNEYLPPAEEFKVVEPAPAPVEQVVEEAAPAHELAADGYRYKTHRRVVYRRNRRDVSHLPSNEYLPPQEEAAPVAAPTNEYLPPVQADAEPAHELAADGYRYKTNRRVVYRRNRRDVSHLPSNEYLPPAEETTVVEAAPVPVEQVVEEATPAHELAADGYRYKTHRRVVYRRNRRDVSHLPSNEYLPPQEEDAPAAVEEVAVAVQEAAPAHELAADGYRYKTHRRVVYRRNRRDVSHLPSNEYLPPAEETQVVEAAPASVDHIVEEPFPAHELAADGYRYKTHRRVVYRRNRRDVSHLPSNEYLPPQEEAAPAAVEEVAVAVQEAAPAHELADDGYRYKTHRRVVYRRNRRDVSHLPSNEYLPPQEEAAPVAAPTNEYLPPVQADAEPAHELAADGYRYKTHRRVVYRRNRRDVSHLPSNEYLPPAEETQVVEAAPAPVEQVVEEAAPAHELAADGYRYKTHRRVVYRRH